jgi:membrane-associated phospholipid phosphatase
MFKLILYITFTLIIVEPNFSQESINFKLFDSLKTFNENYHKASLTVVSASTDPDNFDTKGFRTINNSRSKFKDGFFNTVDRTTFPVAILVPISLFAYSRAYDKTFDENSAYLLSIAEATSLALTIGTKYIVKRTRPIDALAKVYTRVGGSVDKYSFPSGHTSTSMCIAAMFTLRYPDYPLVYAPMFAWSVIIAYGRPYFGMHYPTDLFAGAIYGAGSAVLIYSLRSEFFKFKNDILNEEKNDEGSINSGTASFFVGSFIASSVFNAVFFGNNGKVMITALPMFDSYGSSGMRLRIQF